MVIFVNDMSTIIDLFHFRISLVVFFFYFTSQALIAQSYSNVANFQGLTFSSITSDFYGSGVSFYDINHDGWDDLTIALENDTQAIFFNNLGNLQLSPVKIYNAGETKMFLWVDFDNDDDSDILITTKNGAIHLYENNGNFQFSDVTISAGLSTNIARNYGASFTDYDKDGFLDLHICKYYQGPVQIDSSDLTFFNNLYHNNGDGTFTDVSISSGISNYLRASFMSVWFDYDHDSWPDLYVANDWAYEGSLYRNDGDGTFTYETDNVNIINPGGYSDYMSCSVADYNNDQDLDLFVSNTGFTINANPLLYTNNDGYFTDSALALRLEMPITTWGGLWLDYDNDSYQDLYVATSSLFSDTTIVPQPGFFFRNELPNYFTLMDTIFTSNHKASSHAVAKGDLNQDGFHDIIVANEYPDLPFLWLNSTNANNFIRITLNGTISNSMAIGSWIHVFVAGEQYTQYTLCGENYLGQNSQHHIFGLGQATLVDSVHIEYLSGIVDKYYNLAVNQSYLFTEGELTPPLNLNIQGNNPFCEGDSVLLSVPDMLSYSWSTGDTTQSIVVYSAGTYALNALDTNGLALSSIPVQLNRIDHPIVTFEVQDVSCFNYSDGQAAVQITNEGQAFEILWSTGQEGDSLFGLSEGVYIVNYLDELGCGYTDSISVEEPFPLNVQADIQAQTIDSQGSIQILVNGGVPPYRVSVDSNEIGGSSINLDSGEYVLVVVDSNGCELSEILIIPFEVGTNLVANINHKRSFKISIKPNPTEDLIWISTATPFQGAISWEIIDISGKKILQNQEFFPSPELHRGFQVTLESLTRGVYFFRLTYQNETSMLKLIKEQK